MVSSRCLKTILRCLKTPWWLVMRFLQNNVIWSSYLQCAHVHLLWKLVVSIRNNGLFLSRVSGHDGFDTQTALCHPGLDFCDSSTKRGASIIKPPTPVVTLYYFLGIKQGEETDRWIYKIQVWVTICGKMSCLAKVCAVRVRWGFFFSIYSCQRILKTGKERKTCHFMCQICTLENCAESGKKAIKIVPEKKCFSQCQGPLTKERALISMDCFLCC